MNHHQKITLLRTDSQHPDFQQLIKELDADLLQRYGEGQALYAPFNNTNAIKHVVVAFSADTPIGCGSFKYYDTGIAEIKRMFVANSFRGRGVASAILKELEIWAKELGFNRMVLETGTGQPEAIGLYKKLGYQVIDNYGPYVNLEQSVCLEKFV